MARVAKMPDVQWQPKGNSGRWIIKKRWPKDVRAHAGKEWFRHTFPVSYSQEQANREAPFILEREFWPKVEDARLDGEEERFTYIEDVNGIPTFDMKDGRLIRLKNTRNIAGVEVPVGFDLAAHLKQTMRMNKLGETAAAVDYEDMIREWINDRTAAGTPPKDRAIKNRRSKLEKLFTFLGRTDRNMIPVGVDDLQRYKESLPSNLRFDAFTEINATWGVAERNNKLPNGNPCDKIHIAKPKKGTRKPFSDDEARAILEFATCSDDPLIKWGHWLAAFTGTITEEIIGATKGEFYQVDDVWVWDFTGRTGLKTAYRPRGIPLHPALIRMGFIEWVMGQPDGLLFRVHATKASRKLMDSIRDDTPCGVGITDPVKVHYSWRHRFISCVHDRTSADRARFLAGHAPRDTHARHYLHHELKKLVEAVNGLQDPTVDQPQN